MGHKPGLIVPVIAILAAATVMMRRRGYAPGPHTIVRCRGDHLFTTIWVPGASIKSIRLGWLRFQWCPVGRHWTLVRPVKGADLSDAERREATKNRDIRIP